jgi:hypothetical protein
MVTWLMRSRLGHSIFALRIALSDSEKQPTHSFSNLRSAYDNDNDNDNNRQLAINLRWVPSNMVR